MILIVASMKDIASMNIAQKIIDLYEFEKTSEVFQQKPIYSKAVQGREVNLVFISEESIHAQSITDFFHPKLLVFVSRHASISGIPTLSVHTPGNLTDAADFGGIPKKISVCPASAMKDALLEMAKLKRETRLDYEVSYECTHHGPSLDVPTMFVELGSSPKQWNDLKAAEAVAHAAMTAVSKQSEYPTAVGIGGPHYNAKFTKVALNTPTAFGHIIPKHAVSHVDSEMIKQCIERTVEHVTSVILDWKGIRGEDKDKLVTMLSSVPNLKLQYLK